MLSFSLIKRIKGNKTKRLSQNYEKKKASRRQGMMHIKQRFAEEFMEIRRDMCT